MRTCIMQGRIEVCFVWYNDLVAGRFILRRYWRVLLDIVAVSELCSSRASDAGGVSSGGRGGDVCKLVGVLCVGVWLFFNGQSGGDAVHTAVVCVVELGSIPSERGWSSFPGVDTISVGDFAVCVVVESF